MFQDSNTLTRTQRKAIARRLVDWIRSTGEEAQQVIEEECAEEIWGPDFEELAARAILGQPKAFSALTSMVRYRARIQYDPLFGEWQIVPDDQGGH
jgi:hypothetical protein